jgi:hypothetical protein
MNAFAIAQAGMPAATPLQPVPTGPHTPAVPMALSAPSPRLPVWEERARKRGYPPSTRVSA